MRNVHVIAHTHWDFEWYFTRQHARVQFAYHLSEVVEALESNRLGCYLLDGQLSILDDYLSDNPDKREGIARLVRARRLFIGPWYTQIDEMVTSGEAIVRNLQLGHRLADDLGGVMKVGYLPDSFGQGQDMPKIYRGFDIPAAVFWRGMPHERPARNFRWASDDGSQVLACVIKNGYYAGVDLVEHGDVGSMLRRIATDTSARDLVLPVGGDQRAVDLDLKGDIAAANAAQREFNLIEGCYPDYFRALEKTPGLPTYRGEFIDASASKIHRGIYSSRADLKQLYDEIEHLMVDVVEPMAAIAARCGIATPSGLVDEIWKAVSRGQAHDSSGGCNSDETNRDILHRGRVARELAESIRDYLLRKLASNAPAGLDVFFWNPSVQPLAGVGQTTLSTREAAFTLSDEAGRSVPFEILEQSQVDDAVRRRDPEAMTPSRFWRTTIAIQLTIGPLDWLGLSVRAGRKAPAGREPSSAITNGIYTLDFCHGHLTLVDQRTDEAFRDPIRFDDGGDEGDTYDYSPAYDDWLLDLTFAEASATGRQGLLQSDLTLSGVWRVPKDLTSRAARAADAALRYTMTLTLRADDPTIAFDLRVDNAALDHRLRLVLDTPIRARASYADSPFGVAVRPVTDPHLSDWREIGYCEEPTALRPLIHFANTHDERTSWSFLGLGEKEFQLIGDAFERLAVTMFRGVGYLGRPDTRRRPGDASGLQTRLVETPDSQLPGERRLRGGICIDADFDAAALQRRCRRLACGSLTYQNQAIDRFTTPLRYFPINANPTRLEHGGEVRLETSSLVVSSLSETPDRTGWLLRAYNPTRAVASAAGRLKMRRASSVCLLNLNGEMRRAVASDVRELALAPFRPGEIKTFGIYPQGGANPSAAREEAP